LDLELPHLDGLTWLKVVMEQRPLPVIVMSPLTQRGSDYALEALRLGAFDVLAKPSGSYSFGDLGPQLIARIKASAGARPRRGVIGPVAPKTRSSCPPNRTRGSARDLILLGASTGGTEALCE